MDPGHPLSGTVLELATRLRELADPRQRRRMVDAHLHWLMGAAWEIPATVRRPRPSVNDYLLTRMMYVASAAVLTWVQVSEPDVIDDTEITSRPVRALTEMAGAVRTIGAITDSPAATGPPGIPTIDWWWA
ncbi:terpene synthase family protein [Actinomadura sp. 21ATH]|uniref:terpene synthase family protein n=1 Tax=Actinomadura sp. 21ATH TaxID=1735444 RepID=UPI0035BF9398